jgi:hypothetical protein
LDFIEMFQPGTNPFNITIRKLLNPRSADIKDLDKPILIKLVYILKMEPTSEEETASFEELIRQIGLREKFCGIWTPKVSEISYERKVMVAELTSYLKPGNEKKVIHLDHIADVSPKVKHKERIPKREIPDRLITRAFIDHVKKGHSLGDALDLAVKQGPPGTAPKKVPTKVEETATQETVFKKPRVKKPKPEPEPEPEPEEPPAEPVLRCPDCGEEVETDWRHCPTCNRTLVEEPAEEEPEAPPAEEEPEAPPAEEEPEAPPAEEEPEAPPAEEEPEAPPAEEEPEKPTEKEEAPVSTSGLDGIMAKLVGLRGSGAEARPAEEEKTSEPVPEPEQEPPDEPADAEESTETETDEEAKVAESKEHEGEIRTSGLDDILLRLRSSKPSISEEKPGEEEKERGEREILQDRSADLEAEEDDLDAEVPIKKKRKSKKKSKKKK